MLGSTEVWGLTLFFVKEVIMNGKKARRLRAGVVSVFQGKHKWNDPSISTLSVCKWVGPDEVTKTSPFLRLARSEGRRLYQTFKRRYKRIPKALRAQI